MLGSSFVLLLVGGLMVVTDVLPLVYWFVVGLLYVWSFCLWWFFNWFVGGDCVGVDFMMQLE